MRRKTIFLSLVFLSFASLNADESCPPAKKVNPCGKPLSNPISLYEVFDNQGVNLGARADVLYMNYTSPVLVYASEQSLEDPVHRTLHSHLLDVPGKASVGCNIALLYTMPNTPAYSFETSWYHIHTKFSASDTAHVLPAHIVSANIAADGSVSVKAHININLFDLLVSKKFSLGTWVSMTPAAGLVGGYMDSKNTVHGSTAGSFALLVGGQTALRDLTLQQSFKYEGIGMKIGGRSSFKIWKGFSLTADLFYSALYGYTKASLNYSQDVAAVALGDLFGFVGHYNHHHGRSFFDSLIGLAWSGTMSNDSMFLELHAGWKYQSFSDGWMEFEVELNNAISNLPLSGQGLQAGATFRF